MSELLRRPFTIQVSPLMVWYPILFSALIAILLVALYYRDIAGTERQDRKLLQFAYLAILFVIVICTLLAPPFALLPWRSVRQDRATELANGETLLLTTLGIFVPILLTIWHAAMKEVTEAIYQLPRSDAEAATVMRRLRSEYDSLVAMGGILQPAFRGLLVASLLLLLTIIVAGTKEFPKPFEELLPPLLHLIAEILVIVFIALLGAYVFIVLPSVSTVQHLVFKLRMGGKDVT